MNGSTAETMTPLDIGDPPARAAEPKAESKVHADRVATPQKTRSAKPHLKIAYLFTTFPVTSETFLQREVRVMSARGVDVEIHSLWLGADEWEGRPVKRFRHAQLLKLFWLLPKYIFLRPAVLSELLENLSRHDMPSLLNLGETMRGIGCALVLADEFQRDKPDVFHCVWATMPATAGWILSRITGVPYTMGAHAYDVFKKEGDWLLEPKLKSAMVIHTTTEAARKHLIARGAEKKRVLLVRRGLDEFPHCKTLRAQRRPLRILSVGRLVPKKGYDHQLEIYRRLVDCGFKFEARIVGGGRLEKNLRKRHQELELRGHVDLLGRRQFADVKRQYEWADVLVFTGIVAPDGDRDGLPNVIPEAMAMGLPVISTPVAGATEAVHHEETGFVARINDFDAWHRALATLQDDDGTFELIQKNARAWIERNYDNQLNAAVLATRLKRSVEEATRKA